MACDVYTRATAPGAPARVEVEPGFVVHHVQAGPAAPLPKADLAGHVGAFADRIAEHMAQVDAAGGEPAIAIHANYWLSGVAGHALKHRLGRPLVSTFHTLDRVKAQASADEGERDDPGRRARAEAEVIGCSDAVLASCRVERDQLVELYDADPARVEIVPPGVDRRSFFPGPRDEARRALGLSRSVPLAVFVGRLQPLKGAGAALRAFARLEQLGVGDARFAVIGGPSGPEGEAELARLEGFVRDAGLGSCVDFLPPQPHDLLGAWYRAADCCVVPSRSESFGLVALEAAACGIPVVASAVGGMTTVVEHERTGYLVEPEDVDGFARRLAEVLGRPRLAAMLGARAAERSRAYSWPVAAARLRRLYADLAARRLVECV